MRKIVALFVVLGTVALMVATAAGAERPAFNPDCDGTKIEPVETGTYSLAFGNVAGSITITVRETDAGDVFDFVTDDPTHVVTSIVVKGGTAFLTYTPNAAAGSDLHASLNPSSGKWYGLSHLCVETALQDGGEGEEE